MMWKPTKPGVYLYGVNVIHVEKRYTTTNPRQSYLSEWGVANLDGSPSYNPIRNGAWSLLAPEWQDGAPTAEQLRRWQWWCFGIDHSPEQCGSFFGGDVRYDDAADHLIWNGTIPWDVGQVKRSAPIQPVLTNGPLWVPLDVANG